MRRRPVLAVLALVAAAAIPAPPVTAAPAVTTGHVRSFDGVPIVYTLFLPAGATAARPVPVVLMTHGWGGTRATTGTGTVALLLEEGYAVLTWDQRGFGDSGGEADLDSQEHEVRDVQALIDHVVSVPGIQADGAGDPRMGMVGVSYAGAIQLMVAAADRRVDAIAPEITWNDLPQSLEPGGVPKLGWGLLLYAAGVGSATALGLDSPAGPQTDAVAPQVHQALVEAVATNGSSPQTREYLAARSPRRWLAGGVAPGGRSVPGVRAPTLVLQGTSDTLFPVNEGIANEALVRANGVPTKLVLYCGGHSANPAGTSCRPGAGQAAVLQKAVLAWLDRHVKDPRGDAPTGAFLDYQLQDGTFASAAGLPEEAVSGEGEGTVTGVVVPTSGAGVAATPAPDGLRFPVAVPSGATLLGIPRAMVTVTGTGPEAHLFFKLLDVDGAGRAVVIDDQATARKVTNLSAVPQTFPMDLAGVVWKVGEGHRVVVEVTSSSNDHAPARTPFHASVRAAVDLPVLLPGRPARSVSAAAAASGATPSSAAPRPAPVADPGAELPATGGGTGWTGGGLLGAALALGAARRRLGAA